MLERYKIIEKAKESSTPVPTSTHAAPIPGLNRTNINYFLLQKKNK